MKGTPARSRLEWLLIRPLVLVALVGVLLGMPVIVVGELAAAETTARLTAEQFRAAEAAAVAAGATLNNQLAGVLRNVFGLANSPRARLAILDPDGLDANEFVADGRAAMDPDLDGLFLVNAAGTSIGTDHSEAGRQGDVVPGGWRPFSELGVFRDALTSGRSQFRIEPVDAARVAFQPLIAVAVPGPTGPVGVLLADLRVTRFVEWLRPTLDAGAEDLLVLDATDRMFGRAAGSLNFTRDLSADPALAQMDGDRGSLVADDPLGRGVRLLAYAPVGDFGWRTVLVKPTPEIAPEVSSVLDQQRATRLGLVALLLVGAALVGVTAARSIRRRDALAESLEQQSALSGILRTITASPGELELVLDAIAENAVRFCAAEGALIHLVEPEALRIAALWNWSSDPIRAGKAQVHPERWRGQRLPLDRGTIVGAAVIDRRTTQAPDLKATSDYPETRRFAADLGFRAMLTSPIRRGDDVVGALSLRRVAPGAFSERDIALADAFAVHAGTAIENARLFNETKEALEQQVATSDVLKVISRSTSDLQPVFASIVESSMRLCQADIAWLNLRDETGQFAHLVALQGDVPKDFDADQLARIPLPAGPRPTELPRVLQVSDAQVEDGWPIARQLGARTTARALLIRDGAQIGTVVVARRVLRPFAQRQLDLIHTFADQAVIAIENVRLFNEIQEKSAQLAAASQHKSEFLANMSHELRTPLNAIIGFSEVLREGMFGELNERQREYLEDIRSSGQHLLSLINDVLDLSKVEAGRMELELGEVGLAAVVDEALLLVRERAAGHGITLAVEVPADLPPLTADGRKLKQALLNLVTNAVKFTSDGGWVGVTARRDADDLVISVRDTGVGIAPEDQARIFEEFRQAKHRDGSVEGTGLGLALTKRIVELHGGGISVESELGKGSTFTVRMPLRPAAVAS